MFKLPKLTDTQLVDSVRTEISSIILECDVLISQADFTKRRIAAAECGYTVNHVHSEYCPFIGKK